MDRDGGLGWRRVSAFGWDVIQHWCNGVWPARGAVAPGHPQDGPADMQGRRTTGWT